MSPSNLIRWGGLAAIIAGMLLVVATLLDPTAVGPEPFSEIVQTGSYVVQQALCLLGATLRLVGLVGLYTRQAQAGGALGLAGFLVAFVGMVLWVGFVSDSAFIAPALAWWFPDDGEVVVRARLLTHAGAVLGHYVAVHRDARGFGWWQHAG